MTGPLDTDRAADTDIFIRDLAWKTDARLGGGLRFVACSPVSVTTNAGGDISVPFPGLPTISGAIVAVPGRQSIKGNVTQIPSGGQIPYILGPMYVALYPWVYQANAVGARVYLAQGQLPSAGAPTSWYGAQVAAANQSITVCGIAWGPV